jgi:hypothetical protein
MALSELELSPVEYVGSIEDVFHDPERFHQYLRSIRVCTEKAGALGYIPVSEYLNQFRGLPLTPEMEKLIRDTYQRVFDELERIIANL